MLTLIQVWHPIFRYISAPVAHGSHILSMDLEWKIEKIAAIPNRFQNRKKFRCMFSTNSLGCLLVCSLASDHFLCALRTARLARALRFSCTLRYSSTLHFTRSHAHPLASTVRGKVQICSCSAPKCIKRGLKGYENGGRELDHSPVRSLTHSLTARLALLACSTALTRSFVHSFPSSWNSVSCLWIECIDFILSPTSPHQ